MHGRKRKDFPEAVNVILEIESKIKKHKKKVGGKKNITTKTSRRRKKKERFEGFSEKPFRKALKTVMVR